MKVMKKREKKPCTGVVYAASQNGHTDVVDLLVQAGVRGSVATQRVEQAQQVTAQKK